MDPGAPSDNVYLLEAIDELYARVAYLEKANRVLLNEMRALLGDEEA